MAAADGLLVRIRPPLGRMTGAQAAALAEAAARFGSGLIDLTNRAAIQLRGVGDAQHGRLLISLVETGLVSSDARVDGRAPVLLAPDWRDGDDSHRIAIALAARLGELPPLPSKFGFVVDAGASPVLLDDAGDIRIERGADGSLIVRADGRETGARLPPGGEVDAALSLATWFAASGGAAAGRMARHVAALPAELAGDIAPAPAGPRIAQGEHPPGLAIGVPFGRIDADRLACLAETAAAIRLTPWRMLLIEDHRAARPAPVDPALLAADACVGAPACPRATVETRALASRLAGAVSGALHVSGCAKGCARARPAGLVLTGRDGRFDLGFDARAGDPPAERGLSPADLLARLGA